MIFGGAATLHRWLRIWGAAVLRPHKDKHWSGGLRVGLGFFSCCYGGVFGGDVDGAGDFGVEFFGVVALVHGDAYASAGVDVEQGVADRDVHKGFAEGQGYGLFVDLDGDFVANDVAELLKIFSRNVGDERAERIVEADDVAGDAFFGGYGGLGGEAD